METHCSYISYEQTGYFSKLVIDYLNGASQLKPFYNFSPDINGIQSAIEQRKNFQHRETLHQYLQKQYQGLNISQKLSQNIEALLQPNTFTITTAHQPNIFTGPLYVIYKILHVIKLAEELSAKLPENKFVPAYYMGSEDADLDELNNITINQKKYIWQTKQTGSVGRMKVDKALLKLITEMKGQLSVEPFGEELISIFKDCYKEGTTIQQATLQMINKLFGEYGLIVLIADDAALKKVFQPVLQKELTEQFSNKAVTSTIKKLGEHYKVQASGRTINLFYLIDDKRERIELLNGKYEVRSLNKEWSEEQILKELDEHPERFSPNVILRGVLQETILPNIAFIGGGGELAYWLELKQVFNDADVPYPILILRNSFLLIEKKWQEKLKALGFNDATIFKNEAELIKDFVIENSHENVLLKDELESFKSLYEKISNAATLIDITLTQHVEAIQKQAYKKLTALQTKMIRAEKRKFETQQQQIKSLKNALFPSDNLQERVENFSGFYARSGKDFIATLLSNSLALDEKFSVLTLNT